MQDSFESERNAWCLFSGDFGVFLCVFGALLKVCIANCSRHEQLRRWEYNDTTPPLVDGLCIQDGELNAAICFSIRSDVVIHAIVHPLYRTFIQGV